jgi:hypothetical protein
VCKYYNKSIIGLYHVFYFDLVMNLLYFSFSLSLSHAHTHALTYFANKFALIFVKKPTRRGLLSDLFGLFVEQMVASTARTRTLANVRTPPLPFFLSSIRTLTYIHVPNISMYSVKNTRYN